MSASWMVWALSESIFCWPLGRFFREECFPVEAVCVLPVDFVVLADVVEVWACLWVFVVAGFFADVSSVEPERAPAAVTQASIPNVISARSRRSAKLRQNPQTRKPLLPKLPTTTKNEKARLSSGTVIILDWMLQCQCPPGFFRLRKCTCQEDRSILPGRTARAHQEYDVLPALQTRFDLGEIVFTVDRHLVDFQDDVTATQIHIFRK